MLCRAKRKPAASSRPATTEKRSGWRGTKISKLCGEVFRCTLKASMSASSSPGWVLPAVSTGRVPSVCRTLRIFARIAESTRMSDLILPVTCTRASGTPSALKRFAVAASSAQTSRNVASAGVISRLQRVYPSAECGDRRALTSTTGMPSASAWCRKLGHNSRSSNKTSRGRVARKNRCVAPGRSSGKYLWSTRSP